ncbi:hypothetical protein [Actinoallomurus rhizosphaericola]|uniref:hypothetical protein n=1 Tax=Actinoallomurus rhizosphaericola TaxID=2952536 RepID=UPI00209085A8|nr:hypothetical protein [Actinoallomurus rhizosphaericola]MCO5992785.1 hypothetical protein [Actinoallomurus rhizosphaericola]
MGTSTGEKATIHRKTAAWCLAAGVVGLASLPSAAEAARIPAGPQRRLVTDHNNDGNGHHNATAMSVRSPIRNRGYQHTTNRNAGGVSDAQNGLCRSVRVCNLTQKVTIVNPERPAPPLPPAPTVETAAPVRPAATPVQTAAVPARSAGPLLYMGPYGLMLAGEDSAVSSPSSEDADGPARWLRWWTGPFS